MKILFQIHRKEADGSVTSFVRQFQKHCLTVGDSDTDLPLCDAHGTTKHLMFYQGASGELRMLGAKTSYSISIDSILVDDRKIAAGQAIDLGGITIEVLLFEPDHGLMSGGQPAQEDGRKTPEEKPLAPVTFLGARRRIIPQVVRALPRLQSVK